MLDEDLLANLAIARSKKVGGEIVDHIGGLRIFPKSPLFFEVDRRDHMDKLMIGVKCRAVQFYHVAAYDMA